MDDFDRIIVAEAHRWEIPGMTYEDIAQEVRLHLWLKKSTFRGESSYRTWANKVMKNCIKNLLRDSQTKKARYLNRAVSIEWLKENGYDISRGGVYFEGGE